MRFKIIFFLIINACITAIGQRADYKIEVDVKNYENDTLLVGYFYGSKQLVRDTLIRSNDRFVLAGKDTLHNGAYILMTFPDNEYIQFHVNEKEKEFKISYDYKNKAKVKFDGSKDNTAFHDYLTLLKDARPLAVSLRDTIKILEEKSQDSAPFQNELDALDNKILSTQNSIIEELPYSISALILRSNKEVEVPEFNQAEKPDLERYLFYKKHYWDNIDLANPVTLYSSFIDEKVNFYLEKLTTNYPDSIIKSLDTLLTKMEPAPETFRYYLSTFLNKYGNSKVVSYDAIFVHLVDEYYSKGKTPWVKQESLDKIIDNAKKIKPTLIGKIGADLKVFAEDGRTPITLSEIDYEYLVLMFWAPDCGHCTKSMPKVVEFNKLWQEANVKVFAICTKHRDKTKTCWEDIEKKEMLGFINAADEYHRSRFKVHYNVSRTPRFFVLDKKREILMKGIGAEHLNEVMSGIFKQNNKEAAIPEAVKAMEPFKKEGEPNEK